MRNVILLLLFSFTALFSQVNTTWIRTYNGPAHSIDISYYMVRDEAGFLYVTGSSNGGVSLNDFCTIKYSPGGDSLWVARFDGANTDDIPHGLSVDNAGDVYVAGHGFIPGQVNDFFIVKYQGSTGDTIWTARIPNIWSGSNGRLTKILYVDNSSNVYVTGSGGGVSMAYLTAKLNADGDTLWTRRYGTVPGLPHNAAALTVDNVGNVYVTGASWSGVPPGGSIDFATVKYNSAGQQQWVALYDGPAHSTDYAYAVAVDNAGSVYVTGSCFMDGASNTDFCTIKYNAATGDTLWTRRYDGPVSLSDVATSLLLSNSGSIYVMGDSYGGSSTVGGTGTDYCLIKYTTSGDQQWVFRFNGGGSGEDYTRAFVLDAADNAYITGRSDGDSTYFDLTTVMINPAGQQEWVARYHNASGAEEANAVAVDDSGYFYMAGHSNSDFLTGKFHPQSTGINHPARQFPANFLLYQNYPNPFNQLTIINYQLPIANWVTLKVYDVLGREVKTLVNKRLPAGSYEVNWDAAGQPSGIYFYKLTTGKFSAVKKMLLVK